ncbi:hypothetical protein ACPYO6_08300 [Georgenia sp. Z1344]|uniref:hypothetical protein n=1 Tax=Georgenia sp. Z1344 TaxID=3416706 RepID=UPI003CF7522B
MSRAIARRTATAPGPAWTRGLPALAALALLTASCGGGTDEPTTTGTGTGPAEGTESTEDGPEEPMVEVTDVARTECGRTWEEAYGSGASDGTDGEIDGSAPAGTDTGAAGAHAGGPADVAEVVDDGSHRAAPVSATVRTAAPPPDPELVQTYERRVLPERTADGVLALELTLHGPEDATSTQRLEEVSVEIRDAEALRWVGHAVVDGAVSAAVPAEPAVDVGSEPATTTIEIEPWACPAELAAEDEAAWDRLPDGDYQLVLRGDLEPEPGQASGPRGTWSTDHIPLTVEDGELHVADTRYPHDNQYLVTGTG